MAGRLAGKVALISGTAGGQGRAAALLFASEGAKVVGCDLDALGAKETLAEVEAAGGEMVSMHPIDLTVEADIKRWIDFAVEAYGDFDILYNNAAAMRPGPIEDVSLEDWNWTLEHDLTLVFLTIKYALPVLKRRGHGAIVNTASVAGMNITFPLRARGGLAHCVSKAGVIRLTEVLAIELSPFNIRVNAVSPGCIDTPVLAPLLSDPASKALFEAMSVMDRMGEPEEIARAALFLASDEASFVTGVNLNVDGGSSVSGSQGAPNAAAESTIETAVTRWTSANPT
jgi:NAD(P)-dependent dehydrogenase (short-subunit alcohol dehydrogenase family)